MFTINTEARVNAIIIQAKRKPPKPLNVDEVSLVKVLLVLCRIILQLTIHLSLGLTLLTGSLVSLDVA